MVQQLLRILLVYLVLVGVACSSIHIDNTTKYQKRNIKKFTNKPRYFHKGPGFHVRKYIRIQKSGTYNHPAVTKGAKQRLKSESWLKKIGEGEIDY
jgi:hypothetical protein